MYRLFFLFFCFKTLLFAERTDILFHLHDAGETYALLPVIRQLEVDYLIVTTGISEGLLKDIPKERLRNFAEYGQIEPKEVVTGVASELQGEVLDFFRTQGVRTFAFWDNFNPDGESAYFKIAHSVEPRAEILLLPSESLKEAFSHRKVCIVGHPTLEVSLPSRVILWVGGYGKEYEEALELFQKGAASLEGAVVLMQHHPKTGLKNQLKLIEAIALADLVVCHQSTAAFQALAAGKPVLHVIPDGQFFDSVPLQKGLAKKVGCVEDFAQAVDAAMEMDVSGFFELMGIPQKSIEKCKEALLETLG